MSAQHKENPGRGLQDEDLDLIFPGPDEEHADSRPTAIPARDFKKAAAHDDDFNLMPAKQEPEPPTSGGIRWPEPQKQDVQELTQKTCRPMIDSAAEPKPRIIRRVNGESSPSDKTWRETIKNIFGQRIYDRSESAEQR